MAMCVANEILQNIFELQKQRNNTNEAKKGQTCPKRPKKNIKQSYFEILYLHTFRFKVKEILNFE
jgi:hypothetical protein